MLPNFLVIGAMKAGTTSLWSYLRTHPDVFMSEEKELHFFVERRNWGRGLGWYEAQFRGAREGEAVGEASTTYTMFPRYPEVPERIARTLPGVRLVYVVRNPIERIRSHYRDDLLRGRERRPIERAVRDNPNYVDFSRYALQIERYLKHFPRRRLLVITTEDLRIERSATMERVFRFLDLDPRAVESSFDWELNRTASKRERKPLARLIRRVPGHRAIASRAPGRLRHLHYRLTTRSLEEVPPERLDLPAPLREELADRLAEEVERLERYLGREVGWLDQATG